MVTTDNKINIELEQYKTNCDYCDSTLKFFLEDTEQINTYNRKLKCPICGHYKTIDNKFLFDEDNLVIHPKGWLFRHNIRKIKAFFKAIIDWCTD